MRHRPAFRRTDGDPFRRSLLARSALVRLAGAAVIILCLWLAVMWAVALP